MVIKIYFKVWVHLYCYSVGGLTRLTPPMFLSPISIFLISNNNISLNFVNDISTLSKFLSVLSLLINPLLTLFTVLQKLRTP